ncbi:uncharacterized protein LOC123892147 [Trifolium pratense]|uniref:uncharacterized protein LOC123892147 n=1 Tax=Trifolium pratense TaxID=57577 RepID=UPI001E6906B6|nr:uncharacterized protein LOC123892147 [Trifolium pratense]
MRLIASKPVAPPQELSVRPEDRMYVEGYPRKESNKYNQHLKAKSSPNKGKQVQTSKSTQAGGCNKCGNYHKGECLADQHICYQCKQPGHMKRECPLARKKGAIDLEMPKPARVYTLDAKKSKGNNELITGKCYLNDEPLTVLFDCGASHSFISLKCVNQLNLEVTPLSIPMVITTATDENVETTLTCQNCPIRVGNKTFLIDLICVPMMRMDVILGMDWLSANSVYLRCKEKVVFVPPENMTTGEVISKLLENAHQMI